MRRDIYETGKSFGQICRVLNSGKDANDVVTIVPSPNQWAANIAVTGMNTTVGIISDAQNHMLHVFRQREYLRTIGNLLNAEVGPSQSFARII